MPDTLEIDGRPYQLVARQRSDAAVYKGDETYLRIGEAGFVNEKLAVHKKMEQEGFPVPQLLREGAYGERKYFLEASLGDKRLTDLFAEDVQAAGKISDLHFDQFLRVSLMFLDAQLRTDPCDRDAVAFGRAIHLETLMDELPEYASRIQKRFNETVSRTSRLPSVITHGDFNPANMYPTGVIDFEDSFHGPVGYDMITALTTIDWFPQEEGFEYRARYLFSDTQKDAYLKACNERFVAAGLPALSDFFNGFAFARALWMVARMQQWPKIQKWRYHRFITRYL